MSGNHAPSEVFLANPRPSSLLPGIILAVLFLVASPFAVEFFVTLVFLGGMELRMRLDPPEWVRGENSDEGMGDVDSASETHRTRSFVRTQSRDDLLDPPLPADPPSRFFDDGQPDMLSGRETAFERWKTGNADLWNEMLPEDQSCVRMKYVNAFGRSPELAIDECLAFAERQDAEEVARSDAMQTYLENAGAIGKASGTTIACAKIEYAKNRQFDFEDAIGYCLE